MKAINSANPDGNIQGRNQTGTEDAAKNPTEPEETGAETSKKSSGRKKKEA